MKQGFDVSIIGASGMVGGELLELLEKRKFPVSVARMFSSGKKETFVRFNGKKYKCEKPSFEKIKSSQIAFFVSTDEVSGKLAPRLSKAGVWCIDDSSKFRMDKNVPLIIPEINRDLIEKKSKLIAGPNCTLTPLAVGLKDIHKKFTIEEIRMATYQAVSGAGRRALNRLFEEAKYFSAKKKVLVLKDNVLPKNIAFNVFPQVGSFDGEGYSSEENKVAAEIKKIWRDKKIKISVTAVRVPTIRTHCLAAWIKTRKNWQKNDLEKIFKNTEGAVYLSDPRAYATPLSVEKTDKVFVSRLRKTPIKKEFTVWLAGDNLYKGAALNSVQIAEEIIRKI